MTTNKPTCFTSIRNHSQSRPLSGTSWHLSFRDSKHKTMKWFHNNVLVKVLSSPSRAARDITALRATIYVGQKGQQGQGPSEWVHQRGRFGQVRQGHAAHTPHTCTSKDIQANSSHRSEMKQQGNNSSHIIVQSLPCSQSTLGAEMCVAGQDKRSKHQRWCEGSGLMACL